MPKYYIKSGEFERVVIAKNPTKAVIAAFSTNQVLGIDKLDSYIYVDERGFRVAQVLTTMNMIKLEDEPEAIFTTEKVLKKLGWIVD
jgi:hypothetical protein